MSQQPPPISPFPGLRPFREDEDYLFFGREEQTMELLQRLGTNRFVAVVGPSGSGKSSLVRCGLLSELLGGKLLRAGSSWEIAVTHPGGNPLALLAESLLDIGLYDREKPDAKEQLLATLSRSHFGLVEAVRQARLGPHTNFLLVVDQFEEIFRFREAGNAQHEVATEFVANLLQSVAQSEVPIFVVLTMRSDFIGDCSQFDGLADLVNRGEFLIPRLSREQYKRAIEAPIKVARGSITPRLLQRLLNDLGQQADQLPCLQHALMRTWSLAQQRDPTATLDLEDYQRVGKMSQALSLHADEIYDSLADDRQRQLCARMFQALTVTESEHRGIRRPQRLGMLCQILDAPAAELISVIEAYRQHGVTFLTPPPEVELNAYTIIDISHESLMRVWTRLKNWVDEESQAVGIYRRLSESADLFAEGKAGLYRDPELSIALSWRESRKPNQAWAARYHSGFDRAMEFLELSRAAAQRIEEEREAARQHELEQANRLAEAQSLRAEEQHRSAKRLRRFVYALAGVAIVACVAFAAAAIARMDAEANARRAVLAQQEALDAAQKTKEALEVEQQSRDRAQQASEQERKQREIAEAQTATAVRAQQQLKVALEQAELARNDAEKAQRIAQASQRQAEDDRSRAAAAERQAVRDRKLAEDGKHLAEQSAELAKRREKLFERLLPLLQEHAALGVRQYAQKLQQEDRPLQALITYADFCDLAQGRQQSGNQIGALLQLDSFDLQGIDSAATAIDISIPPRALFTEVLVPAIELGEQQLGAQINETTPLLVSLYTHRASLLQQHPQEKWPSPESPEQLIFQSYDRAVNLEPNRFEHYLGRAVSRFRLPERKLADTLQDLETALRLYPQGTERSLLSNNSTLQLAQLHHARANVLEYIAQTDPRQNRANQLSEAERSHRQSQKLDSQKPQYATGIARTLRKQYQLIPSDPKAKTKLDLAARMLRTVISEHPEYPDAHNEIGEIHLALENQGEARAAFERAIQFGKSAGRNESLYTFYCNLSNSCTRSNDPAAYRAALEAADQAISMRGRAAVEARFYRGLAQWKLGRNSEALRDFTDALKLDSNHAESLLSRSQIVFEMKAPNAPSQAVLKQAYADVDVLLKRKDLSPSELAKAHYVNSLGWLRYHVQDKSEEALLKCLSAALQGARGSVAYLGYAQQVFAHAGGFTWRNPKNQQELARLQQEFKTIQASPAPSATK